MIWCKNKKCNYNYDKHCIKENIQISEDGSCENFEVEEK